MNLFLENWWHDIILSKNLFALFRASSPIPPTVQYGGAELLPGTVHSLRQLFLSYFDFQEAANNAK